MKSYRTAKWSATGFTLLELCLLLIVAVVFAGAIAPALAQIRSQSRSVSSSANLMQIGQARGMYAKDNADRIFTYTWRAGETYIMPDGRERTMSTDIDAMARQNQEIIMRRTGRINGISKIRIANTQLPHRRFVHLVLMDYMAETDGIFPSPIFVDPSDGDLLNWQERPLDYLLSSGSGLPYVGGSVPQGYESEGSWSQSAVAQRWSFGTSYFSTPFAWQSDGPENVYCPISSTPHLFTGNSVDLSGRFMSQVAFPSGKVHMFEEFDREQKRQPYFAYDHAKPEKLMFDGSINTQESGDANTSINPCSPGSDWTQKYVPLYVFPIPLDGLGSNELLNMRYMWTRDGLQGTDYN